jgi:hypothetical protein
MRVPFRWFLPAFHFAIDSILVTELVFQVRAELRREKRPWTASVLFLKFPDEASVGRSPWTAADARVGFRLEHCGDAGPGVRRGLGFRPTFMAIGTPKQHTRVAFSQESSMAEFDPRYVDSSPSPPLMLMKTCTLLPALIADWLIPAAQLQQPVWRRTEVLWLVTYGLLAVTFWHLMGRLADRRRDVYRWCFAMVIIPIVGLGFVASPIWRLGPVLQVLVWSGGVLYLVTTYLWWLTRLAMSRMRGATPQ